MNIYKLSSSNLVNYPPTNFNFCFIRLSHASISILLVVLDGFGAISRSTFVFVFLGGEFSCFDSRSVFAAIVLVLAIVDIILLFYSCVCCCCFTISNL